MSDVDPAKLKVVELRSELQKRGLDAKGVKAVLVKRLSDALLEEGDGTESVDEVGQEATEDVEPAADANESDGDPDQEREDPAMTSTVDEAQEEEPEVSESEPQESAPDAGARDLPETDTVVNMEPESAAIVEQPIVPEPAMEQQPEPQEIVPEPAPEIPAQQQETIADPEPMQEETPAPALSTEETAYTQESESSVEVQQPSTEPEEAVEPMETKEETQPEEQPQPPPPGQVEEKETEKENEQKEEVDKEQKEVRDERRDDRRDQRYDRDREGYKDYRDRGYYRDRDYDRDYGRDDYRSRDRYDHDRYYERDHRDRSPRYRSRSRSPPPEEEDDIPENFVVLDKYNSDLHLKINKDGYSSSPLSIEGFAYVWAGARATYGASQGKVCFEVKLTENIKVHHLPEEETHRHVVRVGFSADTSSFQLGEDSLSYGYGSNKKKCVNNTFEDFGEEFGEGDVITTYLDFEGEKPVISFAKNGTLLEDSITIEDELEGKALFPHVLSKNVSFEVNFGQKEEPFCDVKEGFTLLEKVSVEERVRGKTKPPSKAECEAVMLIGLPGSGKTTIAKKMCEENPDKRYSIIGMKFLIEKMKILGEDRKKTYSGRWDILMDKISKCLNRLYDIAARKRRNYIFDQTNVYASIQRRKMRPFEGFQRKAIVVVPSDEEFKSRCDKQKEEDSQDDVPPEHAVLDMKANFSLPVVGAYFDSVEYIELKEEEAGKVVEEYRKEGRAAGPPPKRFRDDRSPGHNRPYYGRGGYNYGGGGYGRYDNRRGGYGYGGGGGGYRGRGGYGGGYNRGYGGGGYRDRNQDYRGGYGRGGGGYGGGRGGWGRGGGSGGDNDGGGYMGYGKREQNQYQQYKQNQGYGNYNQGGYNQGGYNQQSYNQQGYGNQGYGSQQGYSNQNYNYGNQQQQQQTQQNYAQQYQQYAQQYQQYQQYYQQNPQYAQQYAQYYGNYGNYNTGNYGQQGQTAGSNSSGAYAQGYGTQGQQQTSQSGSTSTSGGTSSTN